MAATEFGLGNALAVQRWSSSLAVETEVQQYFRKFMGASKDSIIQVLKDLEKKPGEKITFGLRMKLAGDGVEGDNVIEGTSAEEALNFYSDSVTINQRRKSTKSKGKASEQRVPYDMRKECRDALSTWGAEDLDQQCFTMLTGVIGINYSGSYAGWHFPSGWTGRANNTLTAVDSSHTIYAGDATSVATIDASDVMSLDLVEKAIAMLETTDPMVQPIKSDGEDKWVFLMHTYQAYSLRKSTSENDWLDIQKQAMGKDAAFWKNSLGEYGGMILHKHRYCVRAAGTATYYVGYGLVMGAQAGVIAYGGNSAYGRYSWNEETDDRGNAMVVTAGANYGIKRVIFNSKTFGLVLIITACNNPNNASAGL